MESKRNRYYALITAVGTVIGMGGYVGNLYPNNIATFGMVGVMMLGFALVRFWLKDDDE